MLIYLLRHGIAADIGPEGPCSDDERPLTDEGVRKLGSACEAYSRVMLRPDRLLSSPLVRARQSASILAESLAFRGEIEETRDLIYSAPPARILEQLQVELLQDACDALALVGHEPHLGHLLGLLTTGSERTAIPLQKGMLAAVEVREPQSMVGTLAFALSQKSAQKFA